MDDRALELVHVLPFRRKAFGVAIVALAHPEEVRGEALRFARHLVDGVDGPEIGLARPARMRDVVVVANVLAEIVLLDHFAHVGKDLFRGRDRRTLSTA
jgi:hypothetical protein